MKVLLSQLGSNGDCLYATILARQLKTDYPDCHLTWAISSKCSHLLANNPYVDTIWEWSINDWHEIESSWYKLENLLENNQSIRGQYDRVIMSQVWPNNFKHFDGTVRPSILRAYDGEISVPIDSVIDLEEAEKLNVKSFIEKNNIDSYKQVAVFECSSKSGQSYVTPQFASEIAEIVSNKLPDFCFILTTHEDIESTNKNVFSAKSLTLRENLALLDYATVFIGCGSGLTVVSTSSKAKNIPNIQILTKNKSMLGSFYHDFEYFGKDSSRFIEMGDVTTSQVANTILTLATDGLESTRIKYHDPIPLTFNFYLETINDWLVKRDCYVDALQSLIITMQRYGHIDDLSTFAKKYVLRNINKDKNWNNKAVRTRADSIMSLYSNYTDWMPTNNLNSCGAILEVINRASDNLPARFQLEPHLNYKTYSKIIDLEIREITKLIDANDKIKEHENKLKVFGEPVISFLALKVYNIPDRYGASHWEKKYSREFHGLNKMITANKLSKFKNKYLKKIHKIKLKLYNARHLFVTGNKSLFDQSLIDHINLKYTHAIIICDKPKFSYLYNQAIASFSLKYDHVCTSKTTYNLSDKTVMSLSKPSQLPMFLDYNYCCSGSPPLILCDVKNDEIVSLIDGFEGKLRRDQELIINIRRHSYFKESLLNNWGEVVNITKNVYWLSKPQEKFLLKSYVQNEKPLPKISIVTVSYNQSQFIERCIKSVISQGYPNLEYIIVDGGSTDGTLDILEKYKNEIDVIISESDKGQSDALNKGFKLATGEIMSWVCSDDELEPNSLIQIGNGFNKYDVDLVAGECRVIDENNDTLNIHQNWLQYEEVISLSLSDLLSFCSVWHKGAFFYQPEVFFTRKIWNKSGAYLKEHLYYAMDYDMFLRFAAAGAKIVHIPNIVGVTRKHQDQKTQDLTMEYLPTIRSILREVKVIVEKFEDFSISE